MMLKGSPMRRKNSCRLSEPDAKIIGSMFSPASKDNGFPLVRQFRRATVFGNYNHNEPKVCEHRVHGGKKRKSKKIHAFSVVNFLQRYGIFAKFTGLKK
jgi:hypothetical protein